MAMQIMQRSLLNHKSYKKQPGVWCAHLQSSTQDTEAGES